MTLKMIIGILVGGFFGFLYYKKVGCPSGTCKITTNRYISTIYGAILGLLVSKLI